MREASGGASGRFVGLVRESQSRQSGRIVYGGRAPGSVEPPRAYLDLGHTGQTLFGHRIIYLDKGRRTPIGT